MLFNVLLHVHLLLILVPKCSIYLNYLNPWKKSWKSLFQLDNPEITLSTYIKSQASIRKKHGWNLDELHKIDPNFVQFPNFQQGTRKVTKMKSPHINAFWVKLFTTGKLCKNTYLQSHIILWKQTTSLRICLTIIWFPPELYFGGCKRAYWYAFFSKCHLTDNFQVFSS